MVVLLKANGLTALGQVKDLPVIFHKLPLHLSLQEYLRLHLH
jgi:hypothetical protein